MARKAFGLCCSPYNAGNRGAVCASVLPLNALKNTFVLGQSAERVVQFRLQCLQADLKPEEGCSQKGKGRRSRLHAGLRVVARKVRVVRKRPRAELRVAAFFFVYKCQPRDRSRPAHFFVQSFLL